MFFLREKLQRVGDPKAVYHALSGHLISKLHPVHVEDLFWETDPGALRLEMARTANTNAEGASKGKRGKEGKRGKGMPTRVTCL